ncbi:MAG: FAD-dependent oxidoreductase [Akkermansiaceae bacterium]
MMMPSHTDVVVVGGGSAGLSAALAAARMGSQVVLLEMSNMLGGMGSQAMVHTFCGLYHPDVSQPPVVANPGLPEEIEKEIRQRISVSQPEKMGRLYVLPQDPEVYDSLTKDLVTKEPTLSLLLGSECVGVSLDGDGFKVQVRAKDNEHTISCGSVVDASANALVAEFLGAARLKVESEKLQRPAVIFSCSNVENEAGDESFRMRLALDIVHAVKSGELPAEAMGVSIRQSPTKDKFFISMDLEAGGAGWNPDDEESVSKVTDQGKDLAARIYVFLRENYSAFSKASEPQIAPVLGIRESWRWSGKYELRAEDIITGETFSDAVALATWPLELRENAKGPRLRYFENNDPSQIPLRSLMSADVDGVFFAGRCMSATHEALASVRVMGTCLATGQAAGLAATLHAKGERDIEAVAASIREQIGLVL